MVSRTISVTEEVYLLLKRFKLPGESFGDTISRLASKKTGRGVIEWMDSSVGFSDLDEDTLKEIELAIEDAQKGFRPEEVKIA